MNPTASQNSAKESVALNSIFASFLLTGGKLVVGLLTGSMGILSEAAHSLLDMGAAVITYFAVRASGKPADKEHPYGHGKIESISALAETLLLFLTSGWIIFEATKRLIDGNTEIEATWYAFAIVLISIGVDYSRSRALMKVAKETHSQALEADALHFQSDIWSSLVVLIGLCCVLFGFQGADAIAALIVALFVIRVGYNMGKRTFDVLIDTAPEGIEEDIRDVLKEIPGILAVERIRTRTMGGSISVDVVVHVSRNQHSTLIMQTVTECTRTICTILPGADVLIHPKAVKETTETIIDMLGVLSARHHHALHDVLVDSQDQRLFISYDLEVDPNLSVTEAHTIATEFENIVRIEFGEDTEINTHLDPMQRSVIRSNPIQGRELDQLVASISKASTVVPELSNIHHILIRSIDGKLFCTAHCIIEGSLKLGKAHEYSEVLEHHILSLHPNIFRVLIHIEPQDENCLMS